MGTGKRTREDISEKIKLETAGIYTIWEAKELINEVGLDNAFEKMEIVTAGTFEPIEGATVHFQFAEVSPKIKLEKMALNDVPAYPTGEENSGIFCAAICGAGEDKRYGGAHVIEELICGGKVRLTANGKITDVYTRRELDSLLELKKLKRAALEVRLEKELKAKGAVNTTEKSINCSMGALLPSAGNINYTGSGEISPLSYSNLLKRFAVGDSVFLGGSTGYIAEIGNSMVLRGNLKEMNSEYIRAGSFGKAGSFLYIGIGFAFPILDKGVLEELMKINQQMTINIFDEGKNVGMEEPWGQFSYQELQTGAVDFNGKTVRTASLASVLKAREIAVELKDRVKEGGFPVCQKQE